MDIFFIKFFLWKFTLASSNIRFSNRYTLHPRIGKKIPISLVRNEISLFTISSIVTTGERELSSCNIYRKFNHSSREPLPVEIPLLVLLIQQKFRGGQRFFPRYFCDVKKKKISREIVSRFIKIVYFFRTRGGCSSGCSALGFEYRHNILRQTRREREREIERERERRIRNTRKIS